MWTPDYFVRYVAFPAKVEGVTIPNEDGTFDIYINDALCEKKRAVVLEHELNHIRAEHFYNDILPVRAIEQQADGKAVPRLPNVFDHGPGVIPCFKSLAVFRDYMFAMRESANKRM